MHAVKKCQLVHLVGALQLSESAQLLQWLVFLIFFFHRVFNENEEPFSCICKRRVLQERPYTTNKYKEYR